MPFHLEEVASLIDEHDSVGVAGAPAEYFGSLTGTRKCLQTNRQPVDALMDCFGGTCLPMSSAVTRTAAARAVGGFNTDYVVSSDYEFWLRLATQVKYATSPRVTNKYRWHASQISSETVGSKVSVRQYEYMYRARAEYLTGEGAKRGPQHVSQMRAEARRLLIRDAWIAARNGHRKIVRELVGIGRRYDFMTLPIRLRLAAFAWLPLKRRSK